MASPLSRGGLFFTAAFLSAAGCNLVVGSDALKYGPNPNAGDAASGDSGGLDAGADATIGTGPDGSVDSGSKPDSSLDSGGDAQPPSHDGSSPPPDSGSVGEAGPLLTCSDSQAVTSVDAGAGPAPGVVTGMVSGPGTFLGGCQIFPANNAWNVDVSSPSIATTTAYSQIPQSTTLHADVGAWSPPAFGVPYNVVSASQPNVSITFTGFPQDSDPGPGGWTTDPGSGGSIGVTLYPIPPNPRIAGHPAAGVNGSDQQLLVLAQGATCGAPCTAYEVYDITGGTAAPWSAVNGAVWNLGSNGLRTLGATSANASGLSILAGLLRLSEVKARSVTHALHVSFQNTQRGYVYPATHIQGSQPLGSAYPPMGLRLRLKAGVDTSGFSPAGKTVADAMKRYGLIVGDEGSDWFIQGDSDDGWNATDPNGSDTYFGELSTDFGKLTGTNFEVLDTGAPTDVGK